MLKQKQKQKQIRCQNINAHIVHIKIVLKYVSILGLEFYASVV